MKILHAAWRFIVDVALRWYPRRPLGDLAAGVTFWILVSLPASVLALLAALGPLERFLSISFSTAIEQNALDFIGRVFNSGGSSVQDAIESLFDQDPNSGLLTVSLAVAVWSVSRGFAGLIRALDDIYEVVDGRPWYHTRVVRCCPRFWQHARFGAPRNGGASRVGCPPRWTARTGGPWARCPRPCWWRGRR